MTNGSVDQGPPLKKRRRTGTVVPIVSDGGMSVEYSMFELQGTLERNGVPFDGQEMGKLEIKVRCRPRPGTDGSFRRRRRPCPPSRAPNPPTSPSESVRVRLSPTVRRAGGDRASRNSPNRVDPSVSDPLSARRGRRLS